MHSQSDPNTSFSAISDRLKHLLDTSQEYLKLKVFQQIAFTMSVFTKLILIGSLVLFGFVFLCVSGAIAIGEALESMSLGYLIMGGGILLFAGILMLFRKSIDRQIIRGFSRVFFN